MMTKFDSKVIGFFAYASNGEVACTGEACVIAGSYSAMKDYLSEISPGGQSMKIKKTRFGEIKVGLGFGSAYAFDEESYDRFYPLAKQTGMNVNKADFSEKQEKRFFIIQFMPHNPA